MASQGKEEVWEWVLGSRIHLRFRSINDNLYGTTFAVSSSVVVTTAVVVV